MSYINERGDTTLHLRLGRDGNEAVVTVTEDAFGLCVIKGVPPYKYTHCEPEDLICRIHIENGELVVHSFPDSSDGYRPVTTKICDWPSLHD